MNTKNGFAVPAALILAAIVILAGGAWYFSQESASEDGAMMDEDNSVMEKEQGGLVMDEDSMMESDSMMTDTGETVMVEDGLMMMHEGTVLAGTDSPYIVFNKSDFDAALKTDKLIVLYFYAHWCPVCRAEQPETFAAFDELTGGDVIGFRVNYNDSDTDADEKALAREHGVGYQHTKVFIKNGERVLKSPESWDKARYLQEISTYK